MVSPLVLGLFLLLAPAGRPDSFEFSGTTMTSQFAKGREQTVLRGNARIKSDKLEILAEEIVLSGTDFTQAECRGNVRVVDFDRDLTLSSRELQYDRKAKVMVALGEAVLEDRKNEVIVKGYRIENREEEEIVLLQVGVRILKEDLSARSEFARYDRENEKLDLSGLPVVYRKKDEYRAARILVDLDTEEITLQGEVRGTLVTDE